MPTIAPAGAVEADTLLEQLNWRYAVKKFDATKRISAADWAALERALVLSPSSFGLQPYKFFVIDDPAVREELMAAAWGQRQVVDASHLVVFAYKKDMGEADVNRFVARITAVRGAPAASLEGYRQMMVGSITGPIRQAGVDAWSAKQAYIALGNFLTSAALLGIDACPMEGFEPAKFDQILGLTAKGYAAAVMATAGYRAADDAYAALPKVRFGHDEIIEHI